MSGTTQTSCWIDASGIHAPSYQDILDYLRAQYRGIYGADAYLANDSQDGQLLALFALALHDANSMAVAVYNAFSPATAQGAGLSSVVKINGLQRLVPSTSSVDLTIIGIAGTTITNGVARDANGNRWLLPNTVTIPNTGQIIVTAFAASLGAIDATPGTISKIDTPQYGWQEVRNDASPTLGAPVETDTVLRSRQTASTMLPSLTPIDGVVGAVKSLEGVTRLKAYENDTNIVDANGLPQHSLAMVVEGGSAQAIGEAIYAKKTPGAFTHGTTLVQIIDQFNVPHTIRFFRPTVATIKVNVSIVPFAGYTSLVGQRIAAALTNHINTALDIGDDVIMTKLIGVANLDGVDATTFRIASLQLGRDSGAIGQVDLITLAFNEVPVAGTVTVTV